VFSFSTHTVARPNKNLLVAEVESQINSLLTRWHFPLFTQDLGCGKVSVLPRNNMTVYEQCTATYSDNLPQVVQCVAEWAESRQNNTSLLLQDNPLTKASEFRTWLLILCGALVFFMQTGFAMICAGCVRKKNMANT
jgi:hypothetical protein